MTLQVETDYKDEVEYMLWKFYICMSIVSLKNRILLECSPVIGFVVK